MAYDHRKLTRLVNEITGMEDAVIKRRSEARKEILLGWNSGVSRKLLSDHSGYSRTLIYRITNGGME